MRVLAAMGILLGGTLLALVFRREPPRDAPVRPQGSEQLVLRKDSPVWPPPRTPTTGSSPSSPRSALPADGNRPGPVVLTPQDRGTLPPGPLKSGAAPVQSSRWGTSLSAVLPEPDRTPVSRTHKVADGDTLEALAERYLGASQRAYEIYEANRDALTDPRILPIGAELKIPQGKQDTAN